MAYIGKQPTPVPLSASDLNDDVISLAKMASGTDGNIISYDASGDPVAIATGNDGQVLTSAGAGQPCAFEAATGGGKINQVVQTLKTDTFTNTTEDAWVDITDMSRAITPSASDSKIIILLSLYGGVSAGVTPAVKIQRDIDGGGYSDCASSIGAAASNRKQSTCGTFYPKDDNQVESVQSITYDDPQTTDEVTYKLQLYQDNTSTCAIGRSGGDGDAVTSNRYPSTITLLEVLA
mgnify:CR=1 FL=1